jgi:uncharacterized protein (TIGR00369 family)
MAADKGGQAMDMLERVNRNMLPFAAHLGIVVLTAEKDRITAEMTVRPEFCTRPDVMHGGAIMAFADTMGGIGAFLNIPEGAGTTTIESKTNFLGPAPVGARVLAEATPIHRGRRTQVWQTRIATAEGKAVALVTQTQLVLT